MQKYSSAASAAHGIIKRGVLPTVFSATPLRFPVLMYVATKKRVEDVKKGPLICQSQSIGQHDFYKHTNPTECEDVRGHDFQGPHFTLVMSVSIRNLRGWKEGQAEVNQCDENRCKSDLIIFSVILDGEGEPILTRPAR
jgi:hypothetical protein